MKRMVRKINGAESSTGSGHANARVDVYEFLKDGIIRGTFGPGEKLNEREIAGLAHVSRTPTREALRRLEYEGFITNVAKKGVFVKKYSLDELDVLHKMLTRLESLAVQMAVPRLSKSDIANLQKMTDRLSLLASKRMYRAYLTLNFEFHLFFARMTESKELLEAISKLRTRIFRYYYAHITLAHNSNEYVNDHKKIVDALKSQSNGRPEKLIEKHIDRARKAFLAFYRDFGP